MAPKHPFAGKSPAQRAADIRTAESWPATAVGWSEASGKLQLTVTHHESATPVEAFNPSDAMLGALCLFWAVAVEALPPLDIGRAPQAGVALLTAVPPGDQALTLPLPLQPYALGPPWLFASAGVGHRWALQPAPEPTQ